MEALPWEQNGFLEVLYRGKRGPAQAFHRPAVERAIRAFVDCFNTAVAAFDPGSLAHGVPPELLRKPGRWAPSVFIPREYGGMGFTLHEYLRAIEELPGSDLSLAVIPLAHLSIGVKGILLFGSEEQKRRWLPAAASRADDLLLRAHRRTSAPTRSTCSPRPAPPATAVVLDGAETFITNANYAGAFTVFAQLDPEPTGRMGAFIVERSRKGSSSAGHAEMGLSASSTAMVRMQNVRLPAESLMGETGSGFRIAMRS